MNVRHVYQSDEVPKTYRIIVEINKNRYNTETQNSIISRLEDFCRNDLNPWLAAQDQDWDQDSIRA
jgi:hypothetical protein